LKITRINTSFQVINYKLNKFTLGLIDINVSLQDPCKEEWEGIEYGTLEACRGGVTTMID
jgi:dihydroorotase-like cyclic amidohydrolase